MASTTNFRGLQVFQPAPPGQGGADISTNFINLVTWNPQSQWAGTAPPTAGDDSSGANGYFFPGSLWLDVSSGAATSQPYLCTSGTQNAAVWLPLLRINSNGSITVPDAPGTVAGNTRGIYAVDLQASRYEATDVASGGYSFMAGADNLAAGYYAVAMGYDNNVSGFYSAAMGWGHYVLSSSSFSTGFGNYISASASYSFACGVVNGCEGGWYNLVVGRSNQITASGSYAFALGEFNTVSAPFGGSAGYHCTVSGGLAFASGSYAVANHDGEQAHGAARRFSSPISCQSSSLIFGAQTSSASQTQLTTDGNAANSNALGAYPNTNRFLLEKKTYACTATITARQSGGANMAMWRRQFLVGVNSSGTGTLSAVQTIGTDIVPAGWSAVAVSIALATNGPSGNPNVLQVLVTGLASTTIYWAAE